VSKVKVYGPFAYANATGKVPMMPDFGAGEPMYEPGKKALICLGCPKGCRLVIDEDGAVSGNSCPRGLDFARQELTAPMRVLSCLMRIEGTDRVFSVRSRGAVPKDKLRAAAEYVYANPLAQDRLPIHVGDVIFHEVFGAEIVATMEICL